MREVNYKDYGLIKAYGLFTRVYSLDKYGYGCAECCTGDRCDEDCDAPYKGRRKNEIGVDWHFHRNEFVPVTLEEFNNQIK